MKILLLECDAEELRANRTVMDTITEALSGFTRAFAGIDLDPEAVAKYMNENLAGENDDLQQDEE